MQPLSGRSGPFPSISNHYPYTVTRFFLRMHPSVLPSQSSSVAPQPTRWNPNSIPDIHEFWPPLSRYPPASSFTRGWSGLYISILLNLSRPLTVPCPSALQHCLKLWNSFLPFPYLVEVKSLDLGVKHLGQISLPASSRHTFFNLFKLPFLIC